MAPSTPQKNKQASKRQLQSPLATSRNSKRVRKEYNTSAWARYFEALSTRSERNKSIRDIDKEYKISKKTNFRWRQDASKKSLENAQRRSDKYCLEQSLKLFDDTLNMLISSTRNFYRDIFLKHQIDQFDLDTDVKTLQRNLKTRRDAQRYKKRKIKTISKANKMVQVAYATKYQHKSLYF